MKEWSTLNWRQLERRVFKLQKRIFKASQRGDVKVVRRLQKTLMRSWSAKCLAVRRVTQDNQGKKTAGVDGIKCLSPSHRLPLVEALTLSSKAMPTRRVYIPKPGRSEHRPLGIPTLYDRALQALVKLALEPEWEARFEPNSYGFRPGRSCHDAIEAIFSSIKQKPKYALDADIAQCFDRINQTVLLKKLNTFPTLRRQIRAWLRAGVMQGQQWQPTPAGTPQGGVISPLLANIALHGMEAQIKQAFPKRNSPSLIRYADDFVVLHEDLGIVQQCQQQLSTWLAELGLELKPSKTRLVHTLKPEMEQVGFDFLGFTIRQFPVGQHQSGKSSRGERLGFKSLIQPSLQKQKLQVKKIGDIIDNYKAMPQGSLIKRLNPVIRGWAQYYASGVSKAIFHKLDRLVYQQLRAWGKRRHSNKSHGWIAHQYWRKAETTQWNFATSVNGKPMRLAKHSETPIIRHIKVKGQRSPFDGDWIYWSIRMGRHPEVDSTVALLLKRQQGICPHCGLFFKPEDSMEIDHKFPKSQGGTHRYTNLELLHRHCHDVKTALDIQSKGMHDKHQLAEEPCDGKLSRTVLKTSRFGDRVA